MRTELLLTFLSLIIFAIQTPLLLGQSYSEVSSLNSKQERLKTSRIPSRIAFISNIGGGQSLYVMDPNQPNLKMFGKLHIDGVTIQKHDLLFSPDGKRVMFVAWSSLSKDTALWVINTDGSAARRLRDFQWPQHSPFGASYSPSGDHVAFSVDEGNVFKIYVMKSDGSDLHYVADGDQLTWSADGRQLAVITDVPPMYARSLRVVDLDGQNIREIFGGGRPVNCKWSPDGRRIACIEEQAGTNSRARFHVSVMNTDGKRRKTILQNLTSCQGLDWSPDATLLSVVGELDGNYGLFLLSPQEASQKPQFISGVGSKYSWSPDSKQIAYVGDVVRTLNVKTRETTALIYTSEFLNPLWLPDGKHLLIFEDPYTQNLNRVWDLTHPPTKTNAQVMDRYYPRLKNDQDLEIYITPVESRAIKRLTDESMHVSDISCPPSGTHIAFAANVRAEDGTTSSAVYSVKPDGSNLRKLNVPKLDPGWFAWSPTGEKIAFVKEIANCTGCDSGYLQIRVANADGSSEQTIVSEPARNFAPAWLPGGEEIIFVSNREKEYRVYKIDIKSKRTRMVADVSRWLSLSQKPETSISWSPDASKFAIPFQVPNPAPTMPRRGIRVIDVSKPNRPFEVLGIYPSVVGWTPDSRQIAVLDLVHDQAMNSITPSKVDLVAVDGSVKRENIIQPFADHIQRSIRVTWTLDGSDFAYNGIMVADADGSNRRLVIRGNRPAWVR